MAGESQGAPSFVLFDGPDRMTVYGELSLDTVWMNEGGPSRGLQVTAWGSALDDQMLELSHLLLGPERVRVELTAGLLGTTGASFVRLDDWPVGPGAEPSSGRVSDNELARIADSQVAVIIKGTVMRSGPSELLLSVAPIEAEQGDVWSVTLDLRRPAS
jgi:hypothetical protein